MSFKLEIRTENSAFYTADEDQEDCFTPEQELARLLREVATRLKQGYGSGRCIDINGNAVGQWELSAP